MSSKTGIRIILGVILGFIAVSLYLTRVILKNDALIAEAENQRYESYKLADELRQSSDDITRMARTYAVTGDQRFKNYFKEIISIRDGKLPRPKDYGDIYWDYVAATSQKPRADDPPVSLLELMRKASFTEAEFTLLKRAKAESDALIALEDRAMAVLEGRPPNKTLAEQLLHGQEYHSAKARIMAPIESFFEQVDRRTSDKVNQLVSQGRQLHKILIFLLAAAALLSFLSLLYLGRGDLKGTDASLHLGERMRWIDDWPLLMAAIGFSIIVGTASWWMQYRFETQERQRVKNALTTIVNSTHKAVQTWISEREEELFMWSNQDKPIIETGDGTYSGYQLLRVAPKNSKSIDIKFEKTIISLSAPTRSGGYLTLLINPEQNFSEILQRGQIGQTGTTFSYTGDKKEGIDLDGYLNSKGKRVVGAWVWDETLGIGVATEMQYDEAFAPLAEFRRMNIVSSAMTILLILILSGLFIQNRWRMADQLAFTQALVDSIPNPIFVKDRYTRFITFNQAYEKVFGMKRESYVGKKVLDVEYIPVEAREGFQREDEENIAKRGGSYKELAIPYSDGKIHDVLYWTKTFELSNGSIGGLLGVLVDISEQKHLERQLAEAKKRMEDELNVGQEIQMSMLPSKFPAFPDRTEFDIFAELTPAREVGGDFYDFFFAGKDELCFCIGDVSGKGVPAALFMAVTKTLIRSRAGDTASPAQIVTRVNAELARDNEHCMFVTLFIGMLNVRTGEIRYANAGHNPPFILRTNGAVEELTKSSGSAAGIVEDQSFKEEICRLNPRDQIILYTDGVTEAIALDGRFYSEERLVELLNVENNLSPKNLVKDVHRSVWAFAEGAEQADDITLLALRFGVAPDQV